MVRAAVLSAALLAGALPLSAQAASVEADPTIRVGLYYGSSALAGANLANEVGEGYRFGYFDEDRAFQELGYTYESTVSMVKTQNVWYGTGVDWNGSGYYDSQTSNIAVGCWHLELPGTYRSFEEAADEAARYEGGFPAWIDGVYTVRVGAYLDQDEALDAQASLGLSSASVAGTSGAGVSVVRTGTNEILFQFDSTQGLYLAVNPGQSDREEAQTHFRGNLYFGAFEYQRSGGDITVVNVLSMDDYIQGVILQEMSASWPLEALKAQAVCARSYAWGTLQASKHQGDGFDLCNAVHCQAYKGVAEMSDNSRRAVEETSGEYLWYNGQVAEQAVYSSHNGGASESAVNVWGNEYPYLTGKIDPYEAAVADRISNYNWTVTFTGEELAEKVGASADIVSFQITETSATGNTIEITLTDANGKQYVESGDDCRTVLGLRSIRYTVNGGGSASGGYTVNGTGTLSTLNGAYAVNSDGDVSALTDGQAYVITGGGSTALLEPSAGGSSSASVGSGDGTFTITGSGWGHSVGLSQWGAYAMAQQGYTYEDILTFYYTGIEVRTP